LASASTSRRIHWRGNNFGEEAGVLRSALTMVLIALSSCSGSVDQDSVRTIFLQLDHAPTSQDLNAVRAKGATSIRTIAIARAIWLRSSLEAAAYADVSGVQKSVDMGINEDPERSVFIDVVDQPTDADTSFVRSAGATQIGILEPATIVTVMPLSALPNLEGYARIVSVTVGLDDNVPQP
jgi:hypothetical protein